jgi:hypothetical protein
MEEIMLSKKWIAALVGAMVAGVCSFAIAGETGTTKGMAQKSGNIPYNLHDEADKTDIYDLPVGMDEEEQDDEMEEMQKEEQAYKARQSASR